MGRGHKTCPNCKTVTSPRAFNCKACNHIFKVKGSKTKGGYKKKPSKEMVCEHIYCNNIFKSTGNKRFCKVSCKQNASKIRNKQPSKKSYCETCGFVAKNRCQLDLDHIDGNRLNNDDSNHQTLCANCHRLKTQDNKDWRHRYKKPADAV